LIGHGVLRLRLMGWVIPGSAAVPLRAASGSRSAGCCGNSAAVTPTPRRALPRSRSPTSSVRPTPGRVNPSDAGGRSSGCVPGRCTMCPRGAGKKRDSTIRTTCPRNGGDCWRSSSALSRSPRWRPEGAPSLVVMAMIYTVGDVAGAHFNPAVTLAFTLRRDFPWTRVPGYWVAQIGRGGGGVAGHVRHHRAPGCHCAQCR